MYLYLNIITVFVYCSELSTINNTLIKYTSVISKKHNNSIFTNLKLNSKKVKITSQVANNDIGLCTTYLIV